LQLADAQHLLAREYGFPSWPRLKTHVESLAKEPTTPARGSMGGRRGQVQPTPEQSVSTCNHPHRRDGR
jgi:hypothetical protein